MKRIAIFGSTALAAIAMSAILAPIGMAAELCLKVDESESSVWKKGCSAEQVGGEYVNATPKTKIGNVPGLWCAEIDNESEWLTAGTEWFNNRDCTGTKGHGKAFKYVKLVGVSEAGVGPELFTLPTAIQTSDSGTSTLKAGSGTNNDVSCTSTASTQNASIAPNLSEVVGIEIEYKGCSGKDAGTTCTSPKTIKTEPLVGTLGTTSQSSTGVGLLILPASGTTFAQIECTASLSTTVTGGIIAEVSPTDKLQSSGTLTFTPNSGSTGQTINEIETPAGHFTGVGVKAFGNKASLNALDTENYLTSNGEASENEIS